MAPGLTQLDANLVEVQYHFSLDLYHISTSCVTSYIIDPVTLLSQELTGC